MNVACPHCDTPLDIDRSHAGHTVHCPTCNGKIKVPAEMATPTAVSSPGGTKQDRTAWAETDPSNVNIWVALLIGLGMMVVVIGALYLVRDTFVGNLFFSGGWVNMVNFVLFFWGMGILILKYRKTQHQRNALMLDVLPKRIGRNINPANVGEFIGHLYRLPEQLRDSMMVNRIRKGLELFEARTKNSEVSSLFQGQSEVDANRIAGSYALVKVFLWAIPILGFVGTVLGLSFAIAGFGTADMSDMDGLSDSIGMVTGGLATAFNTTLLGLILSIILIFPMSGMQKTEEDCLTDIDAFCNEMVLPKLNDGTANDAATNQLLANPAAFAQMLEDFSNSQQQLVENLNAVTSLVQHNATLLEQRSAEHQAHVQETLQQALGELFQHAGDAMNKNSSLVETQVRTLSAGIDSLNATLEKLGRKQIVLRALPRSPWRLFGGQGKKK